MLSIQGGRTGRIAYLEERLVATAWGAIRSDGDTPAVAPHVIRAQGSPSQRVTILLPGLFTGEILRPDKASSEVTAEMYVRTSHKGARAQRRQGAKDPRD